MRQYMLITNDRFETPITVGTAKELSKYLGFKSPQAVYKAEKKKTVCRKYCRVIRLT